jgi:diacylglycerol kinase (ATP)
VKKNVFLDSTLVHMQGKKNVLFIINPISGGRKKSGIEDLARSILDPARFSCAFVETIGPGHAHELAQEAVAQKIDAVIAVGGDGTINEIASALNHTNTALGIVPEGSGNGLALYLGIPLNERAALRRIAAFQTLKIDSGAINGAPFFNMAGIGFDASVSDRFAQETLRGPIGYMKVVLSEIATYQPKHYTLTIDGITYQREAFMISVANSPQYGNNAYIAPKASVNDGILDVCIIKKFPLYAFPIMVYHLFNRSADQSEYVEIIPGKEVLIERASEDVVHVDGEAKALGSTLKVDIFPQSIQVIC